MRSKHIMLMIVSALMLGLLVAPASANKIKDKDGVPGGVKDAGAFVGTATVGKWRTHCDHDGESDVGGPGIGLPVVNGTKNAYYELTTEIDSVFKPAVLEDGVLKVCGRLTKVVDEAGGGLGAACGASKGWDGKGTIDWDDDLYPGKPTIWLKDLVWKTSVGGTLPVTGEANQAPDEEASKEKGKPDFIVATVQAQGATPCASKTGTKPNKSGGATTFNVAGTYEIANGTADQNVGPMCKSGMDEGCLYDEKKEGKSG